MPTSKEALIASLTTYLTGDRTLFNVLTPQRDVMSTLLAYLQDAGTVPPTPPPGTQQTPALDSASFSVVQSAVTGAAAGGKRLAASTAWSARLGTNWHLVLYRDGTIVYEAVYASAVVASATNFSAIPAAPTSVSTNLAADADTGTWVMRIEKDTDRNTYMIVAAGGAASGAKAIIGQDLDGVLQVDASGVVVTLPSSLDVTAGDVTYSESDPRIINWIKPSKALGSETVGIFDYRLAIDRQYSASDQFRVSTSPYNVARNANGTVYNTSYDLQRRYPTESSYSSSSVVAGGQFLLQTNTAVQCVDFPGTYRATMSTMGGAVPHNTPVFWCFSVEPLASMLSAAYVNLAGPHYSGTSPGPQQPFDLSMATGGTLALQLTYGVAGAPAWGSSGNNDPNNKWAQIVVYPTIASYTLQSGRRYTFYVAMRMKNDATGYLNIWIYDEVAAAWTEFVNYTGRLGWDDQVGGYHPKYGLYYYEGASANAGYITDGHLVMYDRAQSGFPAISRTYAKDTLRAA